MHFKQRTHGMRNDLYVTCWYAFGWIAGAHQQTKWFVYWRLFYIVSVQPAGSLTSQACSPYSRYATVSNIWCYVHVIEIGNGLWESRNPGRLPPEGTILQESNGKSWQIFHGLIFIGAGRNFFWHTASSCVVAIYTHSLLCTWWFHVLSDSDCSLLGNLEICISNTPNVLPVAGGGILSHVV